MMKRLHAIILSMGTMTLLLSLGLGIVYLAVKLFLVFLGCCILKYRTGKFSTDLLHCVGLYHFACSLATTRKSLVVRY